MDIGVMTGWREHEDPFEHVGQFGLTCCQLCNWNPEIWSKVDPAETRRQAQTAGVRISAVWAGYPGPATWNFIDGPSTIGLVPDSWRAQRVDALMQGAEFAAAVGAPAIATHVGFVPEYHRDPAYRPTIDAISQVASHCRDLGIGFWFETGQETPVTLLRCIEDIGLDNLGINLDPANLILYGKANPIDALDVFGQWVRCVHAKDGNYPTDGRNLGKEVKVGSGKVHFPRFVARLKELGYEGDLIIEREISGDQQIRDIRETVDYLRALTG